MTSVRRRSQQYALPLPASPKLPRANEIIVGSRIRCDAHVGQALKHDERVVRASAQRLSASEQIHQRRILLRTGLDCPPRQVVEGLILATLRCGEGQLAAGAPFRAIAVSRWLQRGR